MYLTKKVFKTVINNTPLISTVLVIKSAQKQVLLGKSNNHPAQGYRFVPSGRIR